MCVSLPTSDSVREAETSKALSFFRWGMNESTLRGQMGAFSLRVPGESTRRSGSFWETFGVCTSTASHQNKLVVFIWEGLLSQSFFFCFRQLIPCTNCQYLGISLSFLLWPILRFELPVSSVYQPSSDTDESWANTSLWIFNELGFKVFMCLFLRIHFTDVFWKVVILTSF